mgnify:CR=1 FL=1
MKRNINFKNVLCMAAITLVTGMLGGCEDNSIATPVGKLPNETALDNNFGMLKCDMTTSDLEITMTNTKALKIRSSHIRILFQVCISILYMLPFIISP